MADDVRAKAERKFAKIAKKSDDKVLPPWEKEARERAAKIERLRALRLARDAGGYGATPAGKPKAR
jgi:hypothetical protein